MTDVVRETERKYRAGPEAIRALADLPGTVLAPAVRHELDAIYYDTEDLRLLRGGVTLRRRTGGEDAGWHLKLPAGADTREETHLSITEPEPEPVPAELASLTAAHTRGRPLAPVARIRTIRTARRLTDPAGQPLAEIASDTVTGRTLADRPSTTHWDEVEVELLGGDPPLLDEIDTVLRAHGARDAAAPSKLAHLLGERPPSRDEPAAGPGSRAGDVVLDYLRAQVNAIIVTDPRVRRNRPDAVHQMRVATRRARSALQAYGTIIDRDRTRPVTEELKWLADALSAARDKEVILERLRHRLDEIPHDLVLGPVRARITGHLVHGLDEARRSATADLGGARYFALLDALDSLLADPPLTREAHRSAAKALPPLVRRAQRRLERATGRIGSAPDRDIAIHQARKAAKRARYAAEIAVPVLGKPARRQVARTRKLQGVLGDHQDGVVARAVLLDICAQAHVNGENTFTYGLIYERETAAARALERDLIGS